MNSNSTFFERDNYFIDQRAHFSKPYNKYQIFNTNKETIGFVKERMTKGNVFLRHLTGANIFPSQLEIRSANGTLEVLLFRNWFFRNSKIMILDPRKNVLGCIKKKVSLFHSTYFVLNTSDEVIAEISGNDKEWDFMITDSSKDKIGSIDKKWEGIMTQIFRSGDKYNVSIKTDFLNRNDKIAVFSSAIAMYML